MISVEKRWRAEATILRYRKRYRGGANRTLFEPRPIVTKSAGRLIVKLAGARLETVGVGLHGVEAIVHFYEIRRALGLKGCEFLV